MRVALGADVNGYRMKEAIKGHAQVLCLGAKVVGVEVAEPLVDHWIGSAFAGGASARKVAKIEAMDAVRAEAWP